MLQHQPRLIITTGLNVEWVPHGVCDRNIHAEELDMKSTLKERRMQLGCSSRACSRLIPQPGAAVVFIINFVNNNFEECS